MINDRQNHMIQCQSKPLMFETIVEKSKRYFSKHLQHQEDFRLLHHQVLDINIDLFTSKKRQKRNWVMSKNNFCYYLAQLQVKYKIQIYKQFQIKAKSMQKINLHN